MEVHENLVLQHLIILHQVVIIALPANSAVQIVSAQLVLMFGLKQEGEVARVVQVERACNWDYHGNAQLVLCLASFLNLPGSLTVNPQSAALIEQTPEQTRRFPKNLAPWVQAAWGLGPIYKAVTRTGSPQLGAQPPGRNTSSELLPASNR